LLCLGPEKLIPMSVSAVHKAIWVVISKSSPCPNMYCANIKCWQLLNKVILLGSLFVFPPRGNFLGSSLSGATSGSSLRCFRGYVAARTATWRLRRPSFLGRSATVITTPIICE
jgi:hypothetical protein